MWRVIQHRWIRNSDQNFPNEVWSGTRYKEAKGQAKQNINSHLEMLLKHEFYEDADWDIDIDNYSAQMIENGEVVYSIRYEVREDD
jgi:hypothetical protein